MDSVQFLAGVYDHRDPQCDQESWLEYKGEGGEYKVGIPVPRGRTAQEKMLKWAGDVVEKVFVAKARTRYSLFEVTSCARVRVVFDMRFAHTDLTGDEYKKAKWEALEKAKRVFKLEDEVAVEVYSVRTQPSRSRDTDRTHIRCILPMCRVPVELMEKMLKSECVSAFLREAGIEMGMMERVYEETGPVVRVGVVGANLNSKFTTIDLVQLCPAQSLVNGLVSVERHKGKVAKLHPDVVKMMKAEEAQRKRDERTRQQEQGYHVSVIMNHMQEGIDLKDDDLLDETHLLSLFESPNDTRYVAYLNRFMAQVRNGRSLYVRKQVHTMTGQIYLEHITDRRTLMQMYEHMRVEVPAEDGDSEKTKKVNIIASWLEHPKHLMVNDTVFSPGEPTLIRHPLRGDMPNSFRPLLLNTCPDFAYQLFMKRYTPEQLFVQGPSMDRGQGLKGYMDRIEGKPPHEREYLEVLLYHIYYVYCRRNAVLFWAFNAFFCNILMHPTQRMGISLVIVGNFGVGKSVFFKAFGRYALGEGTLYHYFGGDGMRLTQRFNAGFQGVMVFVDEAESADRKSSGRIKSMITEDTLMVERKFGACKAEVNYTNLVYCGNNFAESVPPGDRRMWMMECQDLSKRRLADVRDNVARACDADGRNEDGPLGIMQYVHWLKRNVELFDQFDFHQRPYVTPYKQAYMVKSMDEVYQWWRDILNSGVQPQKSYDPNDTSGWIKWSGESTWGTMWADFKNKYKVTRSRITQQEFERMMNRCCVLKEEEVRLGVVPLAHTDMPLYFGCVKACMAQFDVFLMMGSVHNNTTRDGEGEDERLWIQELFRQDYKKRQQGGVEGQPWTFHDRCQFCSGCSQCWARLSEQDIDAVRVETVQAIEKEEQGVLPSIYYKQRKRKRRQRLSASQDGQWGGQRSPDHGVCPWASSASSDDGSQGDWGGSGIHPELVGAVDLPPPCPRDDGQGSSSSSEHGSSIPWHLVQ